MKPPYDITSQILKGVASISEKIGEINSAHLNKPQTELRKKNRIETIQSSLEIEGNTLTTEQITALINNKRIIAPKKDITEVKNAIKLYDQINEFRPASMPDFKKAHKVLMNGLIEEPGEFRISGVGLVKGNQVTHLAPPSHLVKPQISDLFKYVKSKDELPLIKSCVVHYELEFIHPFLDGNGRMGRFWQTIILMNSYPVFEFLPIESIIKERQNEYYKALNKSDSQGKSTAFIEFMLTILEDSLELLLSSQRISLTNLDRIELYRTIIGSDNFTRQEYLRRFKDISPATASRDLKQAVENGILLKKGDKRTTNYKYN